MYPGVGRFTVESPTRSCRVGWVGARSRTLLLLRGAAVGGAGLECEEEPCVLLQMVGLGWNNVTGCKKGKSDVTYKRMSLFLQICTHKTHLW